MSENIKLLTVTSNAQDYDNLKSVSIWLHCILDGNYYIITFP